MTLSIVPPTTTISQTEFKIALADALGELDQTNWSNSKIIEWLMAQAVVIALFETHGDAAVDHLSEALGRALHRRANNE